MPKITRVISETRPGALQLPRNVPAATAEDLGAGAFRELTAFGGALGQLAQQMQDQADEITLAEKKGLFDAGVADAALEAQKAPDFFERPALFARDTRQLASDLTRDIKSPAVKTAFTAFVLRRLPPAIIGVKADSLKAMAADNAARLDQELINLRRRIAEQTSQDAKEELFDLGMDLINRAVQRNTVSPARGQVLRKSLADDVVEAEILQEIRLDPFQAQEDLLANIFNVDPLDRERHIRTSLVRQRELIRQDREAERQADKIFKEERRQRLGILVERARRGDLTLDDIAAETRVFGFGPASVGLLTELVENEPAGRSDQRILDDILIQVNESPPGVTRKKLFQLRDQHRQGGRGLNRDDFIAQLGVLDRNLAATTTAAKTDLLFRHRQGEGLIKTSLRFQNPLDIINVAAQQTLAVAMIEFSKRSGALNAGGEDPLLLSFDIINKFLPLFQTSAQAAINAERQALPFQTKQTLLNAKSTIGNEAYYFFGRKLEAIAAAERELAAVQAEIKRGQLSGQVHLEPKPTPPREERPPPPPGLEPTPSTLRPPPTTPSPVIDVTPGLRITR